MPSVLAALAAAAPQQGEQLIMEDVRRELGRISYYNSACCLVCQQQSSVASISDSVAQLSLSLTSTLPPCVLCLSCLQAAGACGPWLPALQQPLSF